MKVFLRNHQCPGDILCLTAAVRDLKTAYPYIDVNVETTAMELWDNNPHLSRYVTMGNADRVIDIGYPLINSSNQLPYHFIHAFRKELQTQLGLRIPQGEFKPDLHLNEHDLEPFNGLQNYWIVDAGYKNDYTLKFWGTERFQEVVDLLNGKVTFVQIGEIGGNHNHAPLKNVVDMRGKTSIREFVRLMANANGVITPVSFPMHLSAAIPLKNGGIRPCIVLDGGREPFQWVQYPGHTFLTNVGMLDCCRSGACWRSRGKVLYDGSHNDGNLCSHPVTDSNGDVVGKCMALIPPAIVAYYVDCYETNK